MILSSVIKPGVPQLPDYVLSLVCSLQDTINHHKQELGNSSPIYFFPSLGPFPNTLRQVEIEIISNDICNQINVYGGAVSSGMICAGFLSGKLDACEVRIDSNPQK